jgi:hypothetical protein
MEYGLGEAFCQSRCGAEMELLTHSSALLVHSYFKAGGGGRNRTRLLNRSDRNALSYKADDSLILQGCKPLLRSLTHRSRLLVHRLRIARLVKV